MGMTAGTAFHTINGNPVINRCTGFITDKVPFVVSVFMKCFLWSTTGWAGTGFCQKIILHMIKNFYFRKIFNLMKTLA